MKRAFIAKPPSRQQRAIATVDVFGPSSSGISISACRLSFSIDPNRVAWAAFRYASSGCTAETGRRMETMNVEELDEQEGEPLGASEARRRDAQRDADPGPSRPADRPMCWAGRQ
jgi:hypothetical protein